MTQTPQTEQEKLDIERSLQLLKGEDDQYVLSTLASAYALPALVDFMYHLTQQARLDEVRLIPDKLDNPGDYDCYDLNHVFNQCSVCYRQQRISQLTNKDKEG